MDKLLRELEAAGWWCLSDISTHRKMYRWENGTRVELDLGFDKAGRLVVWSEWHNTRVSIDQEAGRRQRLMERARTERAAAP